MNDADQRTFRTLLLARREELQELATINADASQTVELDQARVGRLSRMDALQGQAMAQASEGRRRRELAGIDAALARLEANEFGFCLRCDENIAIERLRVSPTATLCIRCASSSENN
ncbi:MAG: TraR/DksA family transcriptional regulator [Pseudomonadota bacterium]